MTTSKNIANNGVTNAVRAHFVPKAVRGWVLPIALLLLWWVAVEGAWSTSPLLVHPAKVWDTAVAQATSG